MGGGGGEGREGGGEGGKGRGGGEGGGEGRRGGVHNPLRNPLRRLRGSRRSRPDRGQGTKLLGWFHGKLRSIAAGEPTSGLDWRLRWRLGWGLRKALRAGQGWAAGGWALWWSGRSGEGLEKASPGTLQASTASKQCHPLVYNFSAFVKVGWCSALRSRS